MPRTVDGPGFTGHVQDLPTGLTYMQQRYFDPLVGRFLSADPVQANAVSGTNFNRYWYANNNPYRFTDPDGRESPCITMGTDCGVNERMGERTVLALGEAGEFLDDVDREVLTSLGPNPVGIGGRLAIRPLIAGLRPIAAEARALRAAGSKVPLPKMKSSDFGGKVADKVPDGVPKNWSRSDVEHAIVDYKTSIATRRAELAAFDAAGGGNATKRLAHTGRISEEEGFLRSLEKALEDR